MLGVVVGALGRRSETYIARHIDGVAPGRTFVCALSPHASPVWQPACEVTHLYAAGGLVSRVTRLLHVQRGGSGLSPLDRVWLAHWLATKKISVVLCEYLPIAVAVAETCRRSGVAVVAHAHGYDMSAIPKQSQWAATYAKELPKLDEIVVVSERMRRRVLEYGVSEARVHVVPCGTPTAAYEGEPTRVSSRLRLIAVGRLVAKKGPMFLLESVKRVLDTGADVELVIVGDGPFREPMSQCIAAASLAPSVRMVGDQSNDEVRRLLRTADVFVQHSVTAEDGDEEGLPVSILEAMAEGLPVVATRHAGIPEAVSHEDTGLLVQPGDCGAMAEAIRDLLRDGPRRRAMGLKGRHAVERRYSLDDEIRRLREVISRRWPALHDSSIETSRSVNEVCT